MQTSIGIDFKFHSKSESIFFEYRLGLKIHSERASRCRDSDLLASKGLTCLTIERTATVFSRTICTDLVIYLFISVREWNIVTKSLSGDVRS